METALTAVGVGSIDGWMDWWQREKVSCDEDDAAAARAIFLLFLIEQPLAIIVNSSRKVVFIRLSHLHSAIDKVIQHPTNQPARKRKESDWETNQRNKRLYSRRDAVDGRVLLLHWIGRGLFYLLAINTGSRRQGGENGGRKRSKRRPGDPSSVRCCCWLVILCSPIKGKYKLDRINESLSVTGHKIWGLVNWIQTQIPR